MCNHCVCVCVCVNSSARCALHHNHLTLSIQRPSEHSTGYSARSVTPASHANADCASMASVAELISNICMANYI